MKDPILNNLNHIVLFGDVVDTFRKQKPFELEYYDEDMNKLGTVTALYENEQLYLDGVSVMNIPHEMYRCILKDFRQNKEFDLSYRKHLVHDFSRENYNLVMPYDVDDDAKADAIEIIKSYSTGKKNKPTGIVLPDMVIVVKNENTFQHGIGTEPLLIEK